MTKEKNRELYGVQMLRALAAVAVVFHHTLEQSNGAPRRFSPDWLTVSGAGGVDIFFVISGLIMLHVSFPANGRVIGPGSFLFRRATRIYPFYWLCCFGMLALSAVGFLRNHSWNITEVLTSLLLLQSRVVGVAWTLSYEMYFYLIFAATLFFKSRTLSTVVPTLIILSMTAAGYILPTTPLIAFFTNPIAVEFCFGLWLAWGLAALARHGSDWRLRPWVALFGIVAIAAAPLVVPHATTAGLDGGYRLVTWGIPATLIVASCLLVSRPGTAFARFLVLVGDASYALYLTHAFVMIGYGFLIKRTAVAHLDQRMVVPLIVLLAIGIGLAAHIVVERRIIALIRRLTGREPGQPVPQNA